MQPVTSIGTPDSSGNLTHDSPCCRMNPAFHSRVASCSGCIPLVEPPNTLLVVEILFVTLRGMRKFLFSFWLALVLPAAGAEIKIDFGDAATSLMPTNFHAALEGGGRPGEWKIIMDEVPPLLAPLSPQAPVVTRRAVVAQTSTDPTDERFPMLIYDGGTFNDFNLTTRFKIAGGTA